MPYRKSQDSIIHVVPNDYTVEDFIESRITAPGRENEDDGFFVSNIDKMIAKFHEWNDHLPNIKPFYAVKCNDDPILIRLLHKLGTGFDCASYKEVEMVLGMGIPPSEIIFANSCKKKSSISFASKNGVQMMTFDSENELHKIKEICPDAKLLLRIRPKESKALHGFSCAKFGCTLTSSGYLLSIAKSLNLEVIGVSELNDFDTKDPSEKTLFANEAFLTSLMCTCPQSKPRLAAIMRKVYDSFHVGTGCYDAATFIEPVESARQVFNLAEQYDFKLSVLDVGGGFPGDDSEYHFDHMCNILKETLNENFPPESGVKFIAEPGRFFASASYTLATIITTKKFCIKEDSSEHHLGEPPVPFSKDGPNKGFMYYIDDGIASSFTESVWIPGYEYSKPFPLKGSKGEKLFPSSIWGQTCASMDYITKNCTLPEMFVGDWLYFKNMGAYSSVHASGFNGYTTNKHKYHFIREANWKKVSKYFESFPVHFLK